MAGSRFMMHTKKSPKQQTIIAMLGKPLPGTQLGSDASSAAINVSNDSSDDDDDLPIRSRRRRTSNTIHWSDNHPAEDAPSPYCLSTSKIVARSSPGPSTARKRTVLSSDNESSGGTIEAEGDKPSSSTLPSRPANGIIVLSDDSDSDEDIRPAKRRRRSLKQSSPHDSDRNDAGSDDAGQAVVTPPRAKQSSPVNRAAGSRSARKSARSVRQRHMELLRRRKRGEKVTESDLATESSDEEAQVALYDTDPEHDALSEFEDEEEGEQADVATPSRAAKPKQKGKGKDKQKDKQKERGKRRKEPAVGELGRAYDSDSENILSPLQQQEDESEEDDEDFIDDSHVGLIGEPDEEMLRREMPLQFTSQSRQPLKNHFKDAIEWLVHRRIDRGGAQNDDEIYRLAWDRLDRELGGRAQSRFISSSWTPAFRGALQARPYMDSYNLRPGKYSGGTEGSLTSDTDVCHACGRSNHPASYMVLFSGPVYDLNTLDDVDDGGDEDGEGEGNGEEDEEPVDMHGNPIAPVSQRWLVGGVCHSNAETAHDLLHWKRALKDWVDEKLKEDGQLEPQRLQERDEMKPRRRRVLVHSIVDGWLAAGTINELYGDFVKLLDGARAKSTKTVRFGRSNVRA
ncbi:putative transcription factor iiic-like protein [Grosmannia clavigera kw1407]|uniref:Putative transcription factor iiic-like protein n=1 Tax=Grosmannia clavigera (strain kw1407 / UAMH 11150) TaxID=655863 RepID=F0XPX3_GROCL|nr:putative transcription factor iiic-like protein [Grosmannia clavigera kw1407]EFX00426.1 putative transcription factor iiic-like protein [Grosmannia clavigera kw1407]